MKARYDDVVILSFNCDEKRKKHLITSLGNPVQLEETTKIKVQKKKNEISYFITQNSKAIQI